MNNVFISCENTFPKTITRKKAKGYKSLTIDDNVKFCTSIEIESNDNSLHIKAVESNQQEPDRFTILCKEFGLDDYKNFSSEISVIFLDEGYMLVTLHKGALALNIEVEEGKYDLLAPSLGVDSTPKFEKEDIFWINEESILSYSKYLSEHKSIFLYDFEFMFSVSGTNVNNMQQFRIRSIKEEDKDISLGYYALYITKKQKHKELVKASKLQNMFTNNTGETEFEEDGFEEDDDDVYDF